VESVDVTVGGAGIIGLSVALELARSGFRVQVLEKGRAMREASWAAAGMLAADDPEHPPELRELAAFSIRLFPEYLRAIETLSGHLVPIRTSETLVTTGQGRPFVRIDEVSLDPRDLCAALPAAVVAAGVNLREETEVLSVQGHADYAEVTTTQGTLRTGAFVNCRGAWSGVGVEPRKGQIFKVTLDPSITLSHVIRTPDIYVVPRGGGEVVVGATVEQAGFDRQVEPAAVGRMLAKAATLWPPLSQGQVTESWTGLRPATMDGLPVIGREGPSTWVATGHFRNGILLAPATGVLIKELLEGRSSSVALDAFTPSRLSDKAPSAAL
jgi:glycine oxidase